MCKLIYNYPNNKDYPLYGGRGITICKHWLSDSFYFIDWSLKNGFDETLQIDREDNDGNYEPENCRYVTPSVNSQNQRRPKVPIEFVYDVLHGKYKDLGARKIANLSGCGSTTVSSIRHRDYNKEIEEYKKQNNIK